MKFTVLFFVLFVSAVYALPAGDSRDVQILRYDNDNIGVEGYQFGYELSDGTKREEQGNLKNAGSENEALEVRGTISWVADDGQQYTLTFVADENGYRPEGAHLPKNP